MGVGVGDFNLDGNLDIVKTHFADDTRVLYPTTARAISRRDPALRSRRGDTLRQLGCGIADLDNDGNPDIFWVTGGIYPEMQGRPDQPYRPRAWCFAAWAMDVRGVDGRGRARREGRTPAAAALSGDFDNDGDVDILIVNLNEPPSLLRNDVTGAHHWLKVKLTGANRTAAPLARE